MHSFSAFDNQMKRKKKLTLLCVESMVTTWSNSAVPPILDPTYSGYIYIYIFNPLLKYHF